jgi:hypothetical protein
MVRNDSSLKLNRNKTATIVSVEIAEKPIQKLVNRKRNRITASALENKIKNIKIENLVPSYDYTKKASELGAKNIVAEASQDSVSQAIERSFATASAMDLKEAAASIPAFKIISERIEAELGYPKEFQLAHLYGNFRVYFKVNKRGQIQNDVQISEGQGLLMGYTLMALKTALQEELPESMHFSQEMQLTAEFNFRIKLDDTSQSLGKMPDDLVFKNYLSFHREGRARSKVNRWFHEYFWRKVPPIIPFPGGIYVDFVALYNYIKDYGKLLPGELRKIKLDLLKQKIERNLSVI